MESVIFELIHAFSDQRSNSSIVLEAGNNANIVHSDRNRKTARVISKIKVEPFFRIGFRAEEEN